MPDDKQNPRKRPRADPSAGLDLDALRRKRDRALASRPAVGTLGMDLATLWHGRLARDRARRESSQQPPELTCATSSPTAVYSLPSEERLRLWHGNRDEIPPERTLVAYVSTPRRRKP